MQCRCGAFISPKRADLGYRTCIDCGTTQAAQETAKKQQQVVPAGHKSGYTFVAPEAIKQHVKELNKVQPLTHGCLSAPERPKPKPYTVERKITGFHRNEHGELVLHVKVNRIFKQE